jgi:NADH:ubiquinone oxidoreductase subunit 5 (subunit L)/multisubunit Na+/H+ antiporter MnhA subunit
MAVAVMSTDLFSLFAASEGVSVLTYFITRFWSLRGWPERFARGTFFINQAADLFLLAASYLLYSVFKTTNLYDISISFSGVTAPPLSFFGSAVSPLSLSSTLLVL